MPKLSPVVQRFILHWGEMGTRWGINRTVAQVHALLFLSPEPLNAEAIADTLSIARSNVSTSLKELQSWGIVRLAHVMGDRRDHYESLKDVWEMFRIILEERKKREVDPTLQVLRECVAAMDRAGAAERHAQKRLGEILEFFETVSGCYQEVRALPAPALRTLVRARGKIRRFFGG
jgi:DNA-binding transcriptional regulator GbsR (MarR family)